MLESAQALVDEYAALEHRLAQPEIHSDQGTVRTLNKRYAALAPTVAAYHAVVTARDDLAAARELGAEDESFAAEVPALERSVEQTEETLRRLLIPRDPDDDRDVILEVKAGEGGEESALFAGDLLRMYARYAEKRGWKAEVIDATESDLGGYKDARLSIKARKAPAPGQAPWALLKFEGGVHRVQRVPVTEAKGRVHTSSATVSVLPEAAEVDVDLNPGDLKIDVYRSSGPGGQSVNTTDSAVRITHLPTGIVVAMQDEKSQIQNRAKALIVLRSRMLKAAQDAQASEQGDLKRSQLGGGGRSEKIRTYNFKENRVTDHRINLTTYTLDTVLAGYLDPYVDALLAEKRARQLAESDGR